MDQDTTTLSISVCPVEDSYYGTGLMKIRPELEVTRRLIGLKCNLASKIGLCLCHGMLGSEFVLMTIGIKITLS